MDKKDIRYLVMDVDGTLTDGKIHIGDNGEIYKSFNVKDGYGIHDILIPSGIIPVIMTGRISKIVESRCKELGVTIYYQGVSNKMKQLNEMLVRTDYNYSNVAYIGDDINDLCCMKAILDAGGIIGCPSDAAEEIMEIANFVSDKKGGNGAVRDFIEWIIRLIV